MTDLLLADDDDAFRQVLTRALNKRGFKVLPAEHTAAAIHCCQQHSPDFAVVDLNMPGDSGLVLVDYLQSHHPDCRTVVLTGYASIATAVEAIKLGAIHYLAKPANADEIVAALQQQPHGNAQHPISEQPMSVQRLEWEHIQKVLTDVNGNISEAARRLNMHRRTLQRKLQKFPVKR